LAQAIRDLTSVNRTTVIKAIDWFISKDFSVFCKNMGLDSSSLRESMMKILETTDSEIKKIAEDTISSLRASLWQKKTRLSCGSRKTD